MQVETDPNNKYLEEENIYVGFLGMLNGIFGARESGKYKGWAEIIATFQDNGLISHFHRLTE